MEQSWRHTESWAQLRAWVEVAHGEDDNGLADIARQRAAEDARWEPLLAAQVEVDRLVRAWKGALRARDAEVHLMLDQGERPAEIARRLGVSQTTVARISGNR